MDGEESQPQQEQFISLTPSEEVLQMLPQQWTEIIAQFFPDLQGNKENAGILMAEFCQGLRDVYAKYRTRLPQLAPQDLFLRLSNQLEDDRTFYSKDKVGIVATKRGLEEYARGNPNDLIYLYSPGGEIAFYGSRLDNARLDGFEEGHHAIVTDAFHVEETRSPQDYVSLPGHQYDALPYELRALRAQLRYARAQNRENPNRFGEVTQAILRLRIHRAQNYLKTGEGPQLIPKVDRIPSPTI